MPALRLKAEWYYVLLGRKADLPRDVLPEADVLVRHPEGSRLYSGIVDGLEPSESGAIETLYLLAATRHKKGEDGGTVRVDIPGDVLAVRGSEIHSVNMHYHAIPEPDDPSERRRLRWARLIEAFLREA